MLFNLWEKCPNASSSDTEDIVTANKIILSDIVDNNDDIE